MVITQIEDMDKLSDLDGYGSLEMSEATKEYLKWQILDQVEIVEEGNGYELILEPEREDELDIMRSPAFS
jgi:hypothetical protein